MVDAQEPETVAERLFAVRAGGSTLGTEILGGVTTFLTMAYIIVINPAILEAAGLPRGPSTIATILTAAFGSLLMGFYANRPIAVAPYMGENAFLAYSLGTLVIAGQVQAVTWQERLGTVFVSGAAFLILTLSGVRLWLARAISPSLKHSFAVGIGLFLLLIGLYETNIVRSFVADMPLAALPVQDGILGRPEVPLKIGDLSDTRVLLALFGFVLICLLHCWKVPAALLVGIVATGVSGHLAGVGAAPDLEFRWPWNYGLETIAFRLDISGVLRWSFFPVLLTLFLISFLDTLGTLFALGSTGDMLDERGNLPEMDRPMLVDSLACMFGALVGTSTSGAYIESATGIRAGARTGLAAVVVGGLFLASLFAVPLVQPLQKMSYAYGPALLYVGLLMFRSVRHIAFDDLTESAPALAVLAMTVFTYNIANGLTAGLILYPFLKVASGRWREVHPGAAVLGIMCLLYYLVGRPH